MAQLRQGPSGPPIVGVNPGDLLIWNGTEWLPGPNETGGGTAAAEYWVDPVAGNDNNDGLSLATALRTYRFGLSPKLDGKGSTFVTVNQTSSVVTDDVFWARTFPVGSSGWVYLAATGTTILTGPHVITSVTNAGAGTRGQIVCATADFTGMENRRVRVVDGTGAADGRIGVIQTVVSPTTINVTQAFDLFSEAAGNQFVAGSSIVVESLFTAPALEMRIVAPRTQGFAFGLESLAAQASRDLVLGAGAFYGCSFDVSRLELAGAVSMFGSYVRSATVLQQGTLNLLNSSTRLTSVVGQNINFNRSSQIAVGLQLASGVLRGTNYMHCWDWAASTAAVDLKPGAMADMAVRLHGTSAAANSFGIKTRSGATYGYQSAGAKPTVAGAAAGFNVDCAGTQVLYAAVPVVAAARLSAVCETG